MKSTKGWRGYISSREIGGSTIPQRLQNMVIRNYAQSKGMVFLLSGTEYYMDNCYMMLNALLEELDSLAGLIFYSLKLLPENPVQRKLIYEKVLNRKCELHFALEELAIVKEEDIQLIEDIIACKTLVAQSNSSFWHNESDRAQSSSRK
jgi:sporadic carbohydrate cluster protein (TIGR04323 family)